MKKQLQTIRRLLTRGLGVGLLLGAFFLNEVSAQVSVTATAGTTGPTAYTDVNSAFAAITLGTHQGSITITITGNTVEPTFSATNQLLASGSGTASYTDITIVPQGDVTVASAAAPTGSRGMLEFIGADNITIDGDDPLTPGTRNLTFSMASVATTYCSALRFSSSATTAGTGCRNIIIKNCNIVGSRNSSTATGVLGLGITAAGNTSGTLASLTTGAADNDNWLVENNYFKRLAYGFHAYGNATNVMDSLVIRNNKFGNDTSLQNVGLACIYLGYTALSANSGSAIIQGNELQSGDYTTGHGTGNYGIFINAGNAGIQIRNNNIHDVANPSSGGWQAHGITITSATSNDGIQIYNNLIRDMYAYHYSSGPSTYQGHGIYIGSGVTNISIVHNTIALTKPNLGPITASNSSACIFINSTAVTLAALKNNILVNKTSDGTGQKCMGIYMGSAAVFSSTSGAIDRNNYFVTGASGMVGYIATPYTTLTSWKTITTKDSNSFNVDPVFISPTDVRLQAGVKSPLESNGEVTSITTDIDGNVRPGPVGSIYGGGTAPDIGAHEADLLPDLLTPDSTNVTQITQVIAPGDTSKAILNIKVYVSGSIGTPFNVNSLLISTTGTTSAADIAGAKVFYTGADGNFSTATLYGTVASPSGSFVVTGTQAVGAGVHNFWLAYDISGSATSSNVVDARLDSVSIGSVYLVPTSGNPAGNVTVLNPMTYVSSTTTQSTLTKVGAGATNNNILGIQIVTSSSGAPIALNELTIGTTGTTSLTDISNLKIWYTGNANTFSANTQFGSTIAAPTASEVIIGSQSLLNDTNYFWVTYDVVGAATLSNVIDAECTGLMVAGVSQVPTVISPAGARMIRAEYCNPTHAGTNFITSVVFNNINHTLSPPVAPWYRLFPQSGSTTTTLVRGTTYNITIGFQAATIGSIWIDYNDDGIFSASEWVQLGTNSAGGTFAIPIPCSATLGDVRVRIRTRGSGNANGATDACTNMGGGERIEYTVTILDNPLSYNSSTTDQSTGVVAPGVTDRVIVRVPFRANGCTVGTITEMRFTNTSTVAGNIANAKLYRTPGSTFNISDQRGTTIVSPTGQFAFMLTDTVNLNDTTNYWLAYDISSGAVPGNFIDATFDSVQFMGNYYVPTVSNPAGNIEVVLPMTYLGSTVDNSNTSKVYLNETNREVLRVRVVTSSTGAPINLTSFDINLNGTTDTADIQNINVWYTGNSNVFATTNQFGTTVTNAPATSAPFAFTVSGLQTLVNDSNYFWITYDIKGTATPLNVIDGEVTSITVNSTAQIPSVTAATGNREIRAPYCTPSYANGCGTDFIANVTLDSLSNATGCTGPLTVYNGLAIPNLTRGISYTMSVTYGPDGNQYGRVWIDFNDDGDFSDPGEDMGAQTPANAGSGGTAVFNLAIPCNAALGNLRLRLRGGDDSQPLGTQSCGASGSGWGEAEDYTINILDNPLAYNYSTSEQDTGVVAPGASDRVITRIPVRVDGCGTAILTEVRMSTTGTTSAANITNAKLYRTTGNTFNTTDLRQTIASPSGQFIFTLTDTFTTVNDTTNYWLAYDVSAAAPFSNVLDATLDSIQVLGTYQVPANGNPAGNVLIMAPMSFVSTTTTQANASKVEINSTNNQVIGIEVVTSATGSPVNLTNIDLNLNGTTDTADISNIRVWYTGNSSTFATTTQFGTTLDYAPATGSPFAISVAAVQALNNDTNYFWVTYDVKSGATIGNSIDAECTGLTVNGTPQTPTVTAPAGTREIRGVYCTSLATNAATDGEILGVILGTLNNASACGVAAPGPNSTAGGYSNFTTSVAAPTVAAGGTIPFNVATSTCGGSYNSTFAIWVDYNDDGDFTDANETAFMSPQFFYGIGIQQTGNIVVPLNVAPGIKRVRFVLEEGGVPPISPCTSYGYGETEDYLINILPAPAPTTYIWNQTVTASYITASNWTPARTSKNLNDRLVFNNGGSVTVANVEAESVSSITVNNNTTVNLNGTSGNELAATDSLNLVSGQFVTGANITIGVGSSFKNTGLITGAGSIDGSLSRWIDTLAASYTFPMFQGTSSRAATIAYTTAPTAGGKLNVRYIPGAPGKLGLPLTDGTMIIDSVSIDGVWGATASNGLAGGTFDVTIQADNIAGVTNYTTVRLIARADASSAWLAPGTAVTTTGSNAAMTLSRTGLTAYGQIGIGGDNTNPLPVTLLSFTATAQGKDAVLNWITASETNNSGFNVERSLDGRNFEKVTFVKGAGNSSRTLEYNSTDRNALASAKVVYYRLKQIDFNGKFEYSNIVRVTSTNANVNGISVSPNPFNTDFTVSFNTASTGNASLELVDIQGRTVGTQSFNVVSGINNAIFNNAGSVQPGVYFVKIHLNGETQVLKVVKN